MRTQAIILKKQNTGEYDQIVTCYAEEFGKVAATAKSILKPSSIQAMHLDLFNLVDFELVSSRGMPIITGAQVENSYIGLKHNLPAMAAAYFFAEIIDCLAFEYQKDEKLWQFLVSTIEGLDAGEKPVKDFFKQKQAEFLDVLGYGGITVENHNLSSDYSPESIFQKIAEKKLNSLTFLKKVLE